MLHSVSISIYLIEELGLMTDWENKYMKKYKHIYNELFDISLFWQTL